jgi:hypothetical protein
MASLGHALRPGLRLKRKGYSNRFKNRQKIGKFGISFPDWANSGGACPGGDCPTLYLTEGGDYVIQGLKACEGIKSLASAPADEDLVRVPAEFIQEILRLGKLPT